MAADDIEKFFQELPHKKPDLKKLEASLQEIITQLMAKKEYLDNLEKTLRESQEEDLDECLKEIERIRIRVIFLIDQAKLYLVRLNPGRDESDVQNFTALLKELNLWLTRPRNLVRERVDPNDVLEIEVFNKRLEDSLKECRTKLQYLVSISPRVQELGRNPNLAPLGAQSLIPQLEILHRELTLLDRELTDRLQALQEILTSFINRSREPSKPEPELAATKLNRKTKPAPIFVPQPVPAVRKEDALVRPDGSFTNVCSRTEETYSSFPSPRSTIESTFKPIEMSDPRSVHTKSSKHKKPPVITTETYDDPHRSNRDERTPDNEYSAEQVSQKVFDFLEIDEPESLSLGDETIDSRASPIPNEEVIDLDSPRFEYYEEIKFKDPMLYSQSRPVEQHEMYQTSHLPESSRRRQFMTQTMVDETGKPVTSTSTCKYYVRGARDPQQVKEYKYVQLFDPNNLDETNRFEVSPYDEQPTTVQTREGTRTVIRTIRRRIIRKVVIINGKETVTEEVVEEPVEETVSEYDRPEITEIEDDGQQEPGKQYYVVSKDVKRVEKSKSETPDSSRSRTDESPALEVKKVKSVLRPEAKEFTPSYSLSKSTDISLPQDSSVSSDTTKPTRFGFMIRDSPLDASEHSLPEDTKPDDRTSEPTSNVIYISSKEEDMKGIRPQRKKKKKRKGEKDTEEPEQTEDDQKDTESLDEDEDKDKSDEDLIEKDGKLIKMMKTKTVVVTKDGKSPSLSDSSKASKPKQGSKGTVEEIEKMIIVTDDKARKPHERKDNEKKTKEPTETKDFVGKEKTPVTVSLEKPVERKPKDGKTPIELEAPDTPISIDKETDKKTKDKKGKPDDLDGRGKPKPEGIKSKEQTLDDGKPEDRKEGKPKTDTQKKAEDDKEKYPDDIKVVTKAEDRKSPAKEKLQPSGTTVTETIKFEQEPGKKGKSEVFGKTPDKPKYKFFDISQFIEQEQQPTVDEPFVKEQGDKPKMEKPVKGEEPSKASRSDDKDKTKGKKEKTPDKDKLFETEVKSSQRTPKPKDEESFKVGQPKGEEDKTKPVDESKAPEQREQEPNKVSKLKEEKPVKDKERVVDIGKTPEQKDKEPSQLSKTKEDKAKPIGKDVTEEPKALEKDKVPKRDEPSMAEQPKVEKEKLKKGKTPEVPLKHIGEVKVEDLKPLEQDKLPLKDGEFKVGKSKDIKDKDKREKAPEKDEAGPIDVSKTVEHKTSITHEHRTLESEKPEEKDEIKLTKKHDKRKKEKTPEEDKLEPGKEITETLKFIQFGFRVSPEDERSEVVKPTQDKPKDRLSDKQEPLEVGKRTEQKPRSEDDLLLKPVKLMGRKEITPDKDKPVESSPEQPTETDKPKDDKYKKGKKPEKEKPEELAIAPEQPTEIIKPKEDKDKKGKKPHKDKPEDLAESVGQPKSQEPSKVVEKPVGEKDKGSKEKAKSKPSGKDTYDIAAFIEHEKPSTRDTQDKTTIPEQRKPKDDKGKEEKPQEPKTLLEDNELSKTVKRVGQKEKTPDKDKSIDILGKLPEQPTETGKPKDKDKKGKEPDKDKPEEISKAPEQPRGQEPLTEDKPTNQLDKDSKKEKPTKKDKTKVLDQDTFDVTQFITHERTTRDTFDKVGIPEPGKPKDDKSKKENVPDKHKPVGLEEPLEQPKDDKDTKGKPMDKKKPVELEKMPEKTKPFTEKDEPQKVDQLPDVKEKGKKDKALKKEKPVEVDKKTEQPKSPSEEEKLTLFGRHTEKDTREKTLNKDKPDEKDKVLEPSQTGDKPKDEKELKQKPQDKEKPFSVSKQPEPQKLPYEQEDIIKSDKPKDKRKKEKTPEEDKSKPGKDLTETLNFIQLGYRVRPEDERSQLLKPSQDKAPDMDKPIGVGKQFVQPKPSSEDDHLRTIRLTERKEKTPESVDILVKTPGQSIETDKTKEDKNKKGKKTDKDKPIELSKASEQPTETEKQKDDKGKPEEISKAPELPKSQEPSKVVEKLVGKDDKDRKGKPTQKDKPLDKDAFDVTEFISHEKSSMRDNIDKVGKPEQEKPTDRKEREEKQKQPKALSEDDGLLRDVKRIGRKEKTPDKDKPVELTKAPKQLTETDKPKDDTDKKGKKPGMDKPKELVKALEESKPTDKESKDDKEGKGRKPDKEKPEELAKAPEQPKIQEPSKVADKPTEEKDKDKKEKPIQKDKTKPTDKGTFDVTEFITHERTTRDILDKVGIQEPGKPKDDETKKEKTPDKDKPVEWGKSPEQPTESGKPKDDKDKKGRKSDRDKPEDLTKISEQPKGQEPLKVVEKSVEEQGKERKGKPTPKDRDALDITKIMTHEEPLTRDTLEKVGKAEQEKLKDQIPRTDKFEGIEEGDENTKPSEKDKVKVVKREVVETTILTGEKSADGKDTKKTKKDKDKPKGLEKEVFGTTEFIQRERTLPEDRVTFKTEKDTFGIVKTQEPEKPSKKEEPPMVGKHKDEKASEKPLDVGKTTETKEQEPSKVSKPKDKERKEKTHEDKPKPSEEPKLLEPGKAPLKKEEVVEGKPKEEKEKTLAEKSKQFDTEPDVERLVLRKREPTKDKPDKEKDKAPEEPSVGDKRKDGKKKDKGRKEKTPEEEEPKPMEVFKPEEKDKLPTKEQEPSALGKPKDDRDKPAEMGKTLQQPKTLVGKDKGKKESTPDEGGSKPGREITETLKFIQFGFRVSPEDERSLALKPTEDKPKEPLKGKSPDKDTTKHTIVKVIETTESIQKPNDGKHPDKIEKEKTQEGKPKPLGKVTEDIKLKDAEQIRTGEPSQTMKLEPSKVLKDEERSRVGKPEEEKDNTKKDKTREDKSKPVGTEALEPVKSPDEERMHVIGTKEKTPEEKFKLFGNKEIEEIREDKEPKLKGDKTQKASDKLDQPLEKGKPRTAQKDGADVITFIQHEKSPVSDREFLVAKDNKEKDIRKRDKPKDKDTSKEPSLEKDIFDTTKFIEDEKPVKEGKPVDRQGKEPKEKIQDADKPKTSDTIIEQKPSKPGKPKHIKEKDDRKKEKTPETPQSHVEEESKDKGRKETTPDADKTKSIGKVQEQPKEHVQKVGKPKDDKETTVKTSTEVKTIPAADKLPSIKQEPSKPVKEENKVQRTVDKEKTTEPERPSAGKIEPQKVGQVPDHKDKSHKKDKPIQFGKEPEQPQSGATPQDEEPFDLCKKPEQQKLPSEEELLKGVKPINREKEKTPEEDKLKPGKVVTATLKFIQQEAYPSQQDEPLEVTSATLGEPKRISKAKSPAEDATKHVIVQITEKIKDEHEPSEDQEPSKVDNLTVEKSKDRKGKDKPTPSGKDTFDITTFIEHEKPSTKDTQDKISKPKERKPKDDKEKEDEPKEPKVHSENDELSKIVRHTGRKEKTPDKDKPVELGKAPQEPTETGKPKYYNDKKEKKPDKDKSEELAKVPESKTQELSKAVEEKDKDRKEKPTQKDKTKPTDKGTFDVTEFIAHEKPTRDIPDKVGKPEQGKPLDDKTKKERTPDEDKHVELGRAPEQPTETGKTKEDKGKKGKKPDKVEEFDKALEQPKQVEKPKDDKERKEKTPDRLTETGKTPEKPQQVSEDDHLSKTVRLIGRKEKTPDKDKPVEFGKAPQQPTETDKAKDDKDKKGKKPDKDEPEKVGTLPGDKEKNKKGKDKTTEKVEPAESAKKPEEQKQPSEKEQIQVSKPKDKGRKDKTPDEEKGKPEKEKTGTLEFIQQETYPSQLDEPLLEPKGIKPSDRDKGLKNMPSNFGVDTFETTKLIEHEKPGSKKPDSLEFKIITQGYDEEGKPIKEGYQKKPGETPDVYETTKDGRRIVVSFKKSEYSEDDDSQKKDKKKPEHDDSKPSEKTTPESETDKGKGKAKKEKKHPEEVDKTKRKPEEMEDKPKEPVTGVAKPEDSTEKISVISKEPEKGDDKRVREVLIGKDSKPKPEDTQDSFASILRKGERKTPETRKEKPEEPEQRQKSKKKDRKPKSTGKHGEDLPTDEEEEKITEPETGEKEEQPTDDQTSLTGTIVSMTKKLFGFGGRKESKPETIKSDETTKPSSQPQKDDKAPKKKDKKKEQEEDADKPTERETFKVVVTKEKKPEPAGKEKTVPLGWSVPDEPKDKQPGTSKTILFPDKPSDTQPRHGVIPAPVDNKPEADAFGKLVHKPQKPEKSPESDQAEGKPTKPSAPTYADLFTQTSTPETSPRDTDKAHKTSQTKEYQTTEEGIQTEDDRGNDPVREYKVHVLKDEEPDGKQTTEKYQQTSKPQSPTVTTTTVSSQTSPQAMSPEERDAKKKEKVIRAKFVDKKSGRSKPEDEEHEDKEVESRRPDEKIAETQLAKPEEEKPEKGRDEPFGVYVKAKVSVTPTDFPSKSKKDDKKERKRKWKGEPGQEDEPTDNIEVTGVISVDSPKDLIESETRSWRAVQTPQAEVSVSVKQGDKFVTDFLEGERAALDTTRDDPKGKKDKKSKKPIKERDDEFRLREGGDAPKGVPYRKESSPESDEYGIDVNVRVPSDKSKGRTPGSKHRPESEVDINAGITIDPSDERRVRREKGTSPEDDDKYKVSVDVKVKSGETPSKIPGKTADMGVNVPSPETPLEPEDLILYLEKAKTLGQDRSKKMQNMKNNKRGFTWIIPSSRFVQGEPVKTNIKDIDDNVDKLRDAIARRDYILIQRIFVYLIRNVDDWLELVEYRIRQNRGNPNEGPNQDKVNELRYLNDEIDGVGRNVRELLKTVKEVPSSDKSDIIHQLRTYVEQLEPQIKEIRETTEMEKDNAVKDLSRWEEFLNGVNNLSVIVTENRNNLERVLDSDGSTSSKLEELEKIELANREYMDRALKLIALAKDLANEFPNQEIPPETYTTLETTKLVQSNLDSERDRLLQLLSLADEYEQTLKEFAQVIEVADNLVESPITITSLQHLQDEMQKHRKFFVNLSHCRAILESLESNLDDETRGRYNNLHTKLHAKASSILDKAASRAQQMAMAASKWTILDKGVRNEQQWLQVAHQRLPDLQQVKSTDHDQYISLYQSLASDTAMHHAKILQLMDVANNLQDIITCVGLERFYDDYLNVILKLQEEIRMSLEKLLAFQDMWTLYEIMTKKLDAWMKATEGDLKTLKAAPDRAKMRQFWELKAQYEVHNRLKQEMGNNFEKAVQFLPIADEMYQRQILGKLEDRWKKLEKEIKGIQDSAMATLSAPDVPVNEKLKLLEDELNELNDTVNDLHGIIKTDEELNLYIERLQVLNERLDTIQEELGRLGLLPATESEKVGYLLGLARGLEQQLLEELNQSHCLREKLLALQKGLERTKRNQNSITAMLDQCGAAQSMGSEVVEQAVKTCENVSADLSDQWLDMMDLRKVLHNLPMKLRLSVSPIGVEREFSQLQEIHTVLEERCGSLLNLLRHRLSLWKKFEKQLEKVQQNLEDTDYMVELLTLQGSVDFNRLQTATDRLKDLHDSVAEREDLIKELKELADPLVSSCDPEVASQLNAQVDETVTAWNDTRKNLYEIVDKYKDAVKLWKNYREGRDDIRKWIDQQWGALDILQDKPEEALQHIKECKETLANQKARLDELKKLVAQIAADIGLDPGSFLECEVEDLGKRLEDVKDTLTTLTSVAESNSQGKDDCKDELVKAKKFLGSVQKSLNVVGEDGNTLSTLRDHLLALTKTESQVQNVKERSIKMNEKPHEIRNETSVVEILELWQQVFQETFQQYYRLSAKLVKSQDGAAALQLWQEYLRHVQTFLAGSLPEDYDGLRETQRLCEVHQNLLTSQQSVLLSRKDDPGIRDFSQALQEQFNSLANLHNETLARIMDRHNEVNKRLKLWDTYRHDQSKLLSWLRDMTRDQSRLQLRYIHLRRLPKLLEQIDMLLSRIPQGKAQIQEQKKQQEDIVKFCDEALATSIKMESVATAERINNIEASLKSWKDFLNRVQDLHKNYESELEKVEKVCDEITNELSSPAPVSFSAIQSRLDLCRDLKRRISELSKNIEEANVTYDQLKECLSPYDMKMLSQRLWLIGQRQGDLEHHLLLQILWLEDRLETQQAFNRRHGRFVNWAEDLIKRCDKNSTADPTNKFLDLETRAKRLETEVEIELNLKNREYNALHAMANNIIDLSKQDAAQEKGKIMPKGQNRIDYEIMKSDVEKKIKEVDELWDQLKNLKCARLERKSKLMTTMTDLWKRMEDIKLWLISVEKKLEAPNVIEKSNKKYIDKLLKDHEAIQQNIEKQSGNVGEVLNLCELFLGDPAVDVSGIDTNEFESAQQALEKRWKAVCLSSTERKNRMLGAWELLLELSKICKEQEKWLNDREKALQTLSNQADKLKLSDVQKMLGSLEKEKQELESRSPALKILDASYSKLAQESRLPADNIKELAGPAKAMISKWHNLNGKWKNVWDKISRINKLRDDFIKSHNGSIVMLTNISAKLMQAELIPNLKKRLKKVNELEKELERESGVLRKADETGLELMRTCPEEQNVSATQKMVDEYQIMWKELRDRFTDVKNKSLENVESKEIQVSTLAFETDSEVQVDTLPHMDRLTSRDAYGFELDVALRECDQNLTGLEKILNSSEEEMGANVPTHKALAKIIATCTSSVELVQHLNKTLLEDCGMNDRDARTVQVNEISVRFQDLVARAREREKQLREASERGRLTCPICSGRNWQQLENDLWRLEQWIQYAEAIQRNRPSMPESIEALEDVIQAHRELLIDLDSHRSIIVSLNIVGDHLADHAEDEEKARSLRERLKGLNLRWDNVCTQAAQWQGKLQKALIENPEFHDTIDDLFKWLEHTETVIRNSEPVDLAQDKVIIEAQYKKFKILSKELEKFEPRVQSLQEAAVQLLDKGGSARERLNALRLRLLGMRRLIKVYLIRLGAVLGNESIQALDQTLMSLSQEMLDGADTMSQVPSSSTARTDGDGDIDNSSLRRGFRFLGRVFRASLPIQALMLLVLGAATLVPDEYYSCAFSNNARFQSYYPNGPPPI